MKKFTVVSGRECLDGLEITVGVADPAYRIRSASIS